MLHPDDRLEILRDEFLLRHPAAAYGLALLLFLALSLLSKSPEGLRTVVLRSFVVVGWIIAWMYMGFILWGFVSERPMSALFRVISAMMTVPVHAWTRAIFLICLLVPPVSLLWWRRKSVVSALRLILAVSADWFLRVMENRTSIGAIGGRGPGLV